MPLIVYDPTETTKTRFVEFWSARYKGYDEDFYQKNIGKQLTKQRILDWYEWKNGMPLAPLKLTSVITNFVSRRNELDEVSPGVTAEEFLRRFASGGVVWRIFWLHIWQPRNFPIYDQHVYRAMRFIQGGEKKEISKKDSEKIHSYVDEYLPFYARFDGFNHREVDKALWSFGEFLGQNNFPLRSARPSAR